MERVGSHDIIQFDAFLAMCDWQFLASGAHRETSGMVYCDSENLDDFILHAKRTSGPYVLVTRGDRMISQFAVDAAPSSIKHWLAHNCDAVTPRCTAVPFGLARSIYHYGGYYSGFHRALERSPERNGRRMFLRVTVTPVVYQERIDAVAKFRDHPLCDYHDTHIEHDEFMANVRDHEFVLCPAGATPESTRVWEAIYLGSIPICRRNQCMLPFEDMPIAFCDEWDQIDDDWLNRQKQIMQARSHKRTLMTYWRRYVAEIRARCLR